jgi:hypothetical protein
VAKEDVIEVEGTVIEPLPNATFKVELGERSSNTCPCIREIADALYPYPDRRQSGRAVIAL